MKKLLLKNLSLKRFYPRKLPPLLLHKKYSHASLFVPENLLREAKRQKNISDGQIPSICILDPDGDIVRNLLAADRVALNPFWACYHTQLYNFEKDGIDFGIIGCAVGASFAVLVAEELFVSGCRLLISVTSSGQVKPARKPPFFVLIERALRDEGTSCHYLPPSDYAAADNDLLKLFINAFSKLSIPVYHGATWTTDAPFRETKPALEYAISENILAVEMEAAALYAFAEARHRSVICFAHVTNQMGNIEGDFEKGEADGSRDALELITTVSKAWLQV
ncbi:MAG TPA: uridine phosphorylase [Spirochaetes bacterium]|nr:uridine phosphorylase [Spirochaetota bacterium]